MSELPESQGSPPRQPILWIDTTTLFRTFRRRGTRVSGIPRVVIECIEAARRSDDRGSIRLCRIDEIGPAVREVGWGEFESLMARTRERAPRLPSIRELVRKLPSSVVVRLQRLSFATRTAANSMIRHRHGGGLERGATHPFQSGDTWVNLGCWWHADAPEVLGSIKDSGVEIRVAVMIHDCMPVLFPEYFPPEQVALWTQGRSSLEATTDVVLAGSDNTARDIAFAFPPLADRIRRVQLGDGFLTSASHKAPDKALAALGIDEPFVLLVSTIEARKNHALAFRAWRRLMRDGQEPPLLVFAGTWGWKVADLRAQLEDSNYLDGRVRVIQSPSDLELDALYQGALFTIFPSLYEGWGLPVRESLSYGKVCIASDNSSIPEAGEGLADLVESDCQDSLTEAAVVFFNSATRSHREAEIALHFKKKEWVDSWSTIAREVADRH